MVGGDAVSAEVTSGVASGVTAGLTSGVTSGLTSGGVGVAVSSEDTIGMSVGVAGVVGVVSGMLSGGIMVGCIGVPTALGTVDTLVTLVLGLLNVVATEGASAPPFEPFMYLYKNKMNKRPITKHPMNSPIKAGRERPPCCVVGGEGVGCTGSGWRLE